MPGNTCAFRGCHSREGEAGQVISLFSFPRDPERAKLWIAACYRTDLSPKISILYKNYKLCEHHFEEKYISKGATRKRLLPNALPTIFPKRREEIIKDIEDSEEEPPRKEIILSGITLVEGKPIIPHEPEQSSSNTYCPSTSKGAICEPLILSENKEIEPPLMSSTSTTQTPLQLNNNTSRKQTMRKSILYKNYKLCEHHFEEKYISKGATKKRLLPNALPTIFPKRREEIIEGIDDTEEEPPGKLIILSGIPLVEGKPIIPHEPEQSSSNTYCPSTSKGAFCEPLILPENKEIEPLLTSPTSTTQTPLQLSSNTPRKQKMRKQIKTLRKGLRKSKLSKRIKEGRGTLQDFYKLCDTFLDKNFSKVVKSHAALKVKKRIPHRYSMGLK